MHGPQNFIEQCMTQIPGHETNKTGPISPGFDNKDYVFTLSA